MSYVNLSSTRLCDDDLARLDGFSDVDVLDLSGTLVTDAGLIHLHHLARLQVLVLDGTQVTERGLAALRQALPELSIVISCTFPAPPAPAIVTERRDELPLQIENVLPRGCSVALADST